MLSVVAAPADQSGDVRVLDGPGEAGLFHEHPSELFVVRHVHVRSLHRHERLGLDVE